MEQYFMPANSNSRLNVSNSKTKQEYRQINSELKDIAWKLYDLTCDFKDLQVDARQLCQNGRYDRYEKHQKEYREMKSKLPSREEEEEEVMESKRRGRRRYQFEDDRDFDDFPPRYQQGYSKMKVSREEEACGSSYAAEEYKQKFLKDFDKVLASRRNNHVKVFEEDLEKCKSRYQDQHQEHSSARKSRRGYSAEYESLSTQELEQRLREKLDLLQDKAKSLKENYCNSSSRRNEANYLGSSSSDIRKCRSSKSEKRRNMCSRPSPQRVYLDGGKTYVVDHTDSKVVFIPKNHEY